MRRIFQAGLFVFGAMLAQAAVGGLGPMPTADLSTNTLDFGSIPVSTSSPAMTVTVSNNGLGPLAVTGVVVGGTNVGDYTVATDPASCSAMGSVVVGSSCTVTVTFTPQGLGSSSASITLSDNASTSPQTISLSGIGTAAAAPAVSLSATAIPFGSDSVGTTSSVHVVTVSNSGTAPLDVTGVAIDGANSLDFTIASNTCQSASLAVNASCTLGVTFAAGAAGFRQASLDITSNDPASPASVALIGIGVVVPLPTADLAPGTLSFGSVTMGVTSPVQTVTLTNNGSAPLSITNIGVAGPGFLESSSTCGSSLGAGVACTIGVSFAPVGAGSVSGSVSVTSNAPGSAGVVTLGGIGVDPAPPPAVLSLSPTQLTFEARHVHTSGMQKVVVTNSGTAPMTISAVSVTGPQSADFKTRGDCPIGGTLAPQKSCTIRVTFTPADTGTRAATLTVVSSGTGPDTVSLSGIGTRRCARHDHRDHHGDHWWDSDDHDHDRDHDGRGGH